MAAAAKLQEFRGPRLGDAASLWNIAPAPGWTGEEVAILKLCLMKYGVGSWQAIQRTGLLPGKLVQQLVGQTQRLLGQQSLCAFTGLQVDVDLIRADNDARTDVQRKAGLIINMGRTATAEDKETWRREMQAKYGLAPSVLREAAAELEERAAQRLDQFGGEGLHGAAARAGLHDALECDASQLPPPLAAQLLRRLRTKLGVLVDRLRSNLGLPPADKREWEEPSISAQDPGSDLEMLDGETETGMQDRALPPLPPSRLEGAGRRRGRGRGRGRGAASNRTCSLLKAAQGDASKAEAAKQKKRPAKRQRSGPRSNGSGCGSSEDEAIGPGLSGAHTDPQGSKRRSHRTSTQAAWDAATEVDMDSLVAMGFSRKKAKSALMEVGGNVEEALEWLLTNCV